MSVLSADMDQYKIQIAAGTLCFVLLYAVKIFEETNGFGALLFIFIGVSSSLVCLIRGSPYQAFGDIVALLFRTVSGQTLLFLVATTYPLLFSPKKIIPLWWKGFLLAGVLSSSLIIYHLIKVKMPYGILSNSGMDATFLALLVPYTIHKKYWALSGIIILAILLAHSSSGFGILGIELGIAGLLYLKSWWNRVGFCVGMLSIIPLGHIILGKKLLNDDGRLSVAKLTFKFFKERANYWVGAGPSSFVVFLPGVQATNGSHDIFLWAHNDFLQVLFEYGIIGSTLFLFFYASILYKSRDRLWLFTTIAGSVIATALQMPLRLFPLSLLYALIIKETFSDRATDGFNTKTR